MPHESTPIETIRLSARDKQKLVDYIEHSGKKVINNDRRALRVDFHGRKVLVTITNNHGQRVSHSVLPRNLSRNGIAFVHGRFVYPESRCQVTLPMQNGKWYAVEGEVRTCRHIQGIIHEIAIVFDEPLNLNDFVRLTASQQEKHRAEQSQDFDPEHDMDVNSVGRTLVIDDMATDRKLYRLWLEKLNMATNEASGVTTTIEQMSQCQFDLIMINLELGEESGIELIQHLRGQGFERPIIATSASDHKTEENAAIEAGATAFLVKPFGLEDLRVALEDSLSIDTSATNEADAVYSTLADDAEMLPLIEEFVSTLGPLSMRLRRANADADLKTIEQLCQNLKGAGAGYGFEAITTMARYAMDSLEAAEQDAESIRKTVNDLVQTLRRSRAGVPAES
ncbi:response regulator [Algisphaera agarilytica]|uniref:CheY-like chemotaxis protein n=1 Tax=Algisphaera agarilytica TaxID=1385975 RepID=A0A7X0H5S0_9BACT|nr:response regulator [Algisphaera agarilytica]MBB6429755.1 CheY-like chemotaxis protein [Algisphaera agarilytica]